MALILWSNNAKTTIAGSIAADATTVNLASGAGALFPNPTDGDYFLLTFVDAATKLISEIVKVTARSTDALTIVRAQEGTAARAWTAGDIASNLWTAGAAAAMTQPPTLQAQATNYAVDAGTANAIVVSLTPAPAALAALTGAPLRVKKSAAANTAAVTIAVDGLPATPLVHGDGTAIGSGELPANGLFSTIFDGTNFILQSPMNVAGGVTTAQLQAQGGNYAADSGTANAAAVTLAPVPANLAAILGAPIRVKKIASINTGAITLSVNGLTATPIKLPNGADPLSGMLAASAIFEVAYDGTNFELLSTPTGLAPLNAPALVNPTATTPTDPADDSQKIATTEWVNDSSIVAAKIQAQAGNYAVDSGSTNTVLISLTPAPASLTALAGVPIRIKKSSTDASIPTLKVGSLAAKSIVYPKMPGGSFRTTVYIPRNSIFQVMYNTTSDSFEIFSAVAYASRATNGYTIHPDGTMDAWGTTSAYSQGDGAFVVSFPITFTACYNVQASLINSSAGLGTDYDQVAHVVSWNTTGTTLLVQAFGSASTSQAFPVSWRAVGLYGT